MPRFFLPSAPAEPEPSPSGGKRPRSLLLQKKSNPGISPTLKRKAQAADANGETSGEPLGPGRRQVAPTTSSRSVTEIDSWPFQVPGSPPNPSVRGDAGKLGAGLAAAAASKRLAVERTTPEKRSLAWIQAASSDDSDGSPRGVTARTSMAAKAADSPLSEVNHFSVGALAALDGEQEWYDSPPLAPPMPPPVAPPKRTQASPKTGPGRVTPETVDRAAPSASPSRAKQAASQHIEPKPPAKLPAKGRTNREQLDAIATLSDKATAAGTARRPPGRPASASVSVLMAEKAGTKFVQVGGAEAAEFDGNAAGRSGGRGRAAAAASAGRKDGRAKSKAAGKSPSGIEMQRRRFKAPVCQLLGGLNPPTPVW